MVRRIGILLLAVVLLLSVMSVTASAVADGEIDIYAATRRSYTSSRYSAGMTSFNGYCGKMVSYQLWKMGVVKYPLLADGRDQYDTYKNMERTSTGYYVSAYSGKDYTLEEVLNRISLYGKKDVYNILIGFHKTNREAGSIYGHTCVINGIVDGTVYFVESFRTSLGGMEGNVITCSIEEFAEYYGNWTVFEGVIHFTKDYAGTCTEYGADLFVRARFGLQLRSQPCLVGQEDCRVLRSVSAGERLHVTGVVQNEHGELYYKVNDGDREGYIVAQAAALEQINPQQLTAQLSLPEVKWKGKDVRIQGDISLEHGTVGAVELLVNDRNGETVLNHRMVVDHHTVDMDQFNKELDLSQLSEGRYRAIFRVEASSACVREDNLDYETATTVIADQTLWVGQKRGRALQTQEDQPEKQGWCYENGTWYYYNAGKPCTGWLEQLGVRYYLKEDGSVATGWTEVKGEQYYFTATGALCRGWLSTEEGMRYCIPDGSQAQGWNIIGGSRYYFHEGIMQTTGSRLDGQVEYTFQENGKAVAK